MAHPAGRCLGIDADEAAIQRGRGLAAAAAITNIELRVASLEDLGGDEAGFDYAVAHGFHSWVPEATAELLFPKVSALLRGGGIAMVSHNALPGWITRSLAREVARPAAAGIDDPQEAVRAARDSLVRALRLGDGASAHRSGLSEAIERFDRLDPRLIYHDDLGPINRPTTLAELAGSAADAGLAYLGEATPRLWWRWRLRRSAVDALREQAALIPEGMPEEVRLQMAADQVSGVPFKCPLFVKGTTPGPPDPAGCDELIAHRVALAPATFEAGSEVTRATWQQLDAAGAVGVRIGDLAKTLDRDPGQAAGAVLRLAASGVATLRTEAAPVSGSVPARPVVSRLARAQASIGDPVATLTGETVTLEGALVPVLMRLLDGTRDRESLLDDLSSDAAAAHVPRSEIDAVLDAALSHLAGVGLFERSPEATPG